MRINKDEVIEMFGWRGRIGLILPSNNTVMQQEFSMVVPRGVSVHTARLGAVRDTSPEVLIKMSEHAERAAGELASCDVDIIIYGCTSGSFLKGSEFEKELTKRIYKASNILSFTTSKAMIEALRSVNAKKLAVATPYRKKTNEAEKRFLEDQGFEILRIDGLGIVNPTDIGRLPPYKAYEMGKSVNSEEADTIFISCTDFRTFEIIDPLERDLGKHVISSNQASLWMALKLLNIHMEEKLGSLFSIAK